MLSVPATIGAVYVTGIESSLDYAWSKANPDAIPYLLAMTEDSTDRWATGAFTMIGFVCEPKELPVLTDRLRKFLSQDRDQDSVRFSLGAADAIGAIGGHYPLETKDLITKLLSHPDFWDECEVAASTLPGYASSSPRFWSNAYYLLLREYVISGGDIELARSSKAAFIEALPRFPNLSLESEILDIDRIWNQALEMTYRVDRELLAKQIVTQSENRGFEFNFNGDYQHPGMAKREKR